MPGAVCESVGERRPDYLHVVAAQDLSEPRGIGDRKELLQAGGGEQNQHASGLLTDAEKGVWKAPWQIGQGTGLGRKRSLPQTRSTVPSRT